MHIFARKALDTFGIQQLVVLTWIHFLCLCQTRFFLVLVAEIQMCQGSIICLQSFEKDIKRFWYTHSHSGHFSAAFEKDIKRFWYTHGHSGHFSAVVFSTKNTTRILQVQVSILAINYLTFLKLRYSMHQVLGRVWSFCKQLFMRYKHALQTTVL